MEDFYSYVKEDNDDDSVQYSFTTDHNLIYTVKFDAYLYQESLTDFPTLLQNGYAFGFFPIDVMPNLKKPQDPKIWLTIHKIIGDFMFEYGDDVVLLYHCDAKDGKHPFRNRLFRAWERSLENSSNLFRKSLQYQRGANAMDWQHYVYMGAIISKANPNIIIINEEFDRFGVELSSADK